jgi:hypothetical protein
MKKYLNILISVVALLGCSARPARAQVTYTSPQTIQQTLATNTGCTGSAQNFPVQNLGQTQHFVTATTNALPTSFQMVIQGIDNAGNAVTISDVGGINGNIAASGYFPVVRVQVTCLPIGTGTFSLNYAGTSGTPLNVAGSYLFSQFDKFLFKGVAANTNQNVTFQSPTMSSAGKLNFQYVTTAVAGSSVTVFCTGSTTVGAFKSYTFSIANDTNAQSFYVPASQCPSIQVSYTSGGAASTLNLEYIFDPPGLITGATQTNSCPNVSPITIAAGVTSSIANPGVDHKIAVCALMITPGIAGTVQLVEGTGGTCTTPTNVSGIMSVTVGTPPFPMGAGSPIWQTINAGDQLCLSTVTATVAGFISFQVTP